MRTTSMAALAAGVALGLSACGSGSSPEDTVKDFVKAAHDKDYKTYCEMLAPDTVKAFEQAAKGKKCEDQAKEGLGDEAAQVDPDKLEVTDSTEDGDTATVSTEYDGEKSKVTLVKVDGDWKVDLAGTVGSGATP